MRETSGSASKVSIFETRAAVSNAAFQMPWFWPYHGRTGYDHGCKCDVCVDAERQHYRRRDRQKLETRWKTTTLIRKGLLVPAPCEIGEGCHGRVEAHHDDYTKPWSVRWLCRWHHAELHRQ